MSFVTMVFVVMMFVAVASVAMAQGLLVPPLTAQEIWVNKEAVEVTRGKSAVVPLPTEITVKLVQEPPKVITRTVRVPAEPALLIY